MKRHRLQMAGKMLVTHCDYLLYTAARADDNQESSNSPDQDRAGRSSLLLQGCHNYRQIPRQHHSPDSSHGKKIPDQYRPSAHVMNSNSLLDQRVLGEVRHDLAFMPVHELRSVCLFPTITLPQSSLCAFLRSSKPQSKALHLLTLCLTTC